MKKILHYGLDSKLGGIETYLYKLYNNINRDEFHFDFLVIGHKEPCWYSEFTNMGSTFYNITPRNRNPFKNRTELDSLFKEQEFDILHCHLNTLSYIEPVLSALKNNIPVIVHSRNAGATKSLISNFLHKFNYLILPRKNITMLAVSDLAGSWLFGRNSNYTVVNNGLDINKYTFSDTNRKRIRAEFKINDELLLVHIGAMRIQKNHMFLLDIFKVFLTKSPNSKLLLVGDGDLKEMIVNKIKELEIQDKVILAGKRNDISDILSAADLFLFPSIFEGFPNAVLEAETSGLPCLISKNITDEVLVNENCVAVSLEENVDEWANALLSLNHFDDRTVGAKNIKRKGFSVNAEIIKIESIYRELIHNSNS